MHDCNTPVRGRASSSDPNEESQESQGWGGVWPEVELSQEPARTEAYSSVCNYLEMI